MKRIIYQLLLFAMMLTVSFSCGDKNSESESECGDQKIVSNDAYYNLFSNPSIIYWGVTNGIRSFTYNYEYGNMCTKKNPKVQFFFTLVDANPVLSNPLSINAGVYTCLGVQAQHVTLTPYDNQRRYVSSIAEIGMNQCFSGQSSATIHPYMTVSFNTLGSSHADSVYLAHEIIRMEAEVTYFEPK